MSASQSVTNNQPPRLEQASKQTNKQASDAVSLTDDGWCSPVACQGPSLASLPPSHNHHYHHHHPAARVCQSARDGQLPFMIPGRSLFSPPSSSPYLAPTPHSSSSRRLPGTTSLPSFDRRPRAERPTRPFLVDRPLGTPLSYLAPSLDRGP
jgi:hypothetical protein